MENLNQQIVQFLSQPGFAIPFILWSIIWKGWALWRSATKRQLIWFVILLLFNTMGFLEIAYIFFLNKWDLDQGKLLSFLEKTFHKNKKS